MSPWSTLQQEVSAWAFHNFGKQGAWQPMLGLIEEVGEFLAARELLHGAVHVGTPRSSQTAAHMEDAIADQCIYVCNLCEITGLSLQAIADEHLPGDLTDAQILKTLAAASHAVLKYEQGIRGVDEIVRKDKMRMSLSLWFSWAAYQCGRFGLRPILQCTQEVWKEVSKRDWKKNPVSANEDAALQKQESSGNHHRQGNPGNRPKTGGC